MSKYTPFQPLHEEAAAKLVDFAGYRLPLRYKQGIIKEHLWCRQHCALFDVSHMGQVFFRSTLEPVTKLLEKIVPSDLSNLTAGKQLYTLLLNDAGGIVDDCIIAKPADGEAKNQLFAVLNAARKEEDCKHIQAHLPSIIIERLEKRALLAVQGPAAVAVLSAQFPSLDSWSFMSWHCVVWQGIELFIARSGYTGEDGFEVSLPPELACDFARLLLQDERVAWAGLGARDSLRLEAGFSLYGHDLDEQTTPIEASLLWTIAKARRSAGGFLGAEKIEQQLAEGVSRKRVGLDIEGAAPCREGCEVYHGEQLIGQVTSGGFSPSLSKPIAMAYLDSAYAKPATEVELLLRKRRVQAKVCKLPFYKK